MPINAQSAPTTIEYAAVAKQIGAMIDLGLGLIDSPYIVGTVDALS